MAARNAADNYAIGDTSYTFNVVAARSRHLLVNMARKTTLHVKATSSGTSTKIEITTGAAGGSTPIVSNDQGVLTFEVNGTLVK